jgi:hypothetical protein
MSNRIPSNGQLILNVVAGDRIAAVSRSPFTVYQQVGLPNFPNAWAILQEVAADTEYRSAAFAGGAVLRIDAGPADVLYAEGVGAVITELIGQRRQSTPGVLNATGTLTAAMITSGIVTSTTAAAVTATLNTGAIMDAALDMEIDESFDWSAIATGANAFTVTPAAAGHTVEGSGVVATGTSGAFRTRKTAADTFVTYRLA